MYIDSVGVGEKCSLTRLIGLTLIVSWESGFEPHDTHFGPDLPVIGSRRYMESSKSSVHLEVATTLLMTHLIRGDKDGEFDWLGRFDIGGRMKPS